MPALQPSIVGLPRWLDGLGLGRYLPAFVENRIRGENLPQLTVRHLTRLGIEPRDRETLMAAIAAMSPCPSAEAPRDGLPATAPPDDAHAERRQITTMFCDLVGSTALSEQMDPEELSDVIRGYQECCVAIVEQFGGHVDQYLGDGILIYFWLPQADEHNADRAARAGLRAVEAVTRLPTRHGEHLHARVGIATGIVVAQMLPEDRRRQQVVGETPSLAAQLQTLAAPDEVVICDN